MSAITGRHPCLQCPWLRHRLDPHGWLLDDRRPRTAEGRIHRAASPPSPDQGTDRTVYPDGKGIVVHLDEPAVCEDGTPFDDHAVHKVLDSAGIQRTSEVVEATLDEVRAAIAAVRAGRPRPPGPHRGLPDAARAAGSSGSD